jgi:hypothetical protein
MNGEDAKSRLKKIGEESAERLIGQRKQMLEGMAKRKQINAELRTCPKCGHKWDTNPEKD